MAVAGNAAGRALAAFVRARGFRVRLRVPLPAGVGDDGEQLGLTSPEFEDREIGPGVFRKTSSSRVLLVLGDRADEGSFADAVGVVVGETVYRIEGCEALRAGDGVYGYALMLIERQETGCMGMR